MRKNKQSCRGTSMIELITALTLVSLGVFGALQMYHHGIGQMRHVAGREQVMRAIQNEIETLRAQSFEQLTNGEAMPFKSDIEFLSKLPKLEATTTVSDWGDPALCLKQVEVCIVWVADPGRWVEKTGTTLIAGGGAQ